MKKYPNGKITTAYKEHFYKGFCLIKWGYPMHPWIVYNRYGIQIEGFETMKQAKVAIDDGCFDEERDLHYYKQKPKF